MQLSSIYLHSNRHVHLFLKSYFLSFYMLIGSRDLASESIVSVQECGVHTAWVIYPTITIVMG